MYLKYCLQHLRKIKKIFKLSPEICFIIVCFFCHLFYKTHNCGHSHVTAVTNSQPSNSVYPLTYNYTQGNHVCIKIIHFPKYDILKNTVPKTSGKTNDEFKWLTVRKALIKPRKIHHIPCTCNHRITSTNVIHRLTP